MTKGPTQTIDAESFITFRGSLFLEQITGRELLFGSTVHTTYITFKNFSGTSALIGLKLALFHKEHFLVDQSLLSIN
jgi:hypothetical protein